MGVDFGSAGYFNQSMDGYNRTLKSVMNGTGGTTVATQSDTAFSLAGAPLTLDGLVVNGPSTLGGPVVINNTTAFNATATYNAAVTFGQGFTANNVTLGGSTKVDTLLPTQPSSGFVGTNSSPFDNGAINNLAVANLVSIYGQGLAYCRSDFYGCPGFASLASPNFTGTVTAPTASPKANSTQVATTAYVDAAVAAGGSSSGTSATAAPATNVTSVTCATATCSSYRGTYTVNTSASFTGQGAVFSLSWTATSTPLVCSAISSGPNIQAIYHSIPTATGFTILTGTSSDPSAQTFQVDYFCQP